VIKVKKGLSPFLILILKMTDRLDLLNKISFGDGLFLIAGIKLTGYQEKADNILYSTLKPNPLTPLS